MIYNLKITNSNNALIAFISIFMMLSCCNVERPEVLYGSVKDIDGNTYKTVQIGNQTWMAENLRTTRFRNGDTIPYLSSDDDWKNTNKSGMCYYNNSIEDLELNGVYYNGFAIKDYKGIAPEGWRIASQNDIQELMEYISLQYRPEEALISRYKWLIYNHRELIARIDYLQTQNKKCDQYDIYGFSGIPCGERNKNGEFQNIGSNFMIWSSTRSDPGRVMSISGKRRYRKGRYFFQNRISTNTVDMNYGVNVRCIKLYNHQYP